MRYWVIATDYTFQVIESETRPLGDYATQAFTGRSIYGPFETYEKAYEYGEQETGFE